MTVPFHIKKIFQEKTITGFLESRGIKPDRKHEDRWVYKCPVHRGDNDPSFVVYLEKEEHPQNYYCFGCHSGTSIINLLSDIDDISLKKAASKLLEGIDIKDEDVLNSILEDMNKYPSSSSIGVDEIVLKINRMCYDFLNHVGFDKDEVVFFDSVYKKIDELAIVKDLDTLNYIHDIIADQGLQKRIDKFLNKEEEKIVQQLSEFKK